MITNPPESVVLPSGIELCFQTFGQPSDAPLLLVMGYTAQMTTWSEGFVAELCRRGFYVIRFDNRDSGLSSKTPGDAPDALGFLTRASEGQDISSDVPYTLADMAGDALGLLDHLGVAAAHVVGASMGGMIVQELAIGSPNRLLSATSIMSTTGNAEVGQADPATLAALITPPPTERTAAIAHMIEVNRLIGGPLWNRELATENATASFDRSFYPAGGPFQMSAIAASGDRSDALAAVQVPFLVIHGRSDSLIGVSGGFATADAVTGADLLVLDAMGHDVPEVLWPQVCDAIAGIAFRPTLS